jgi:hypothetical protein
VDISPEVKTVSYRPTSLHGVTVQKNIDSFSPEDGDIMGLRNVTANLQVNTISHPRTSSAPLPPLETEISTLLISKKLVETY